MDFEHETPGALLQKDGNLFLPVLAMRWPRSRRIITLLSSTARRSLDF